MSIPSNYEINVATRRADDGRWTHYCRIQLSETTQKSAIARFHELENLFGEGYKLTLTYWECSGTEIIETID